MSNKNLKNIIEINGRLYDASSGQLIRKDSLGSTIEDIASVPASNIQTPANLSKPSLLKVPGKRAHHTAASHNIHHRPQPTKTLRREVVSRPLALAKSPTNTNLIKHRPRSIADITLSHASHPARNLRAASIARSELVGKYRSPLSSGVQKSHAPLAVATPPAESATLNHEQIFRQVAIAHHNKTGKHSLRHRAARRFKMSKKLSGAAATVGVILLLFGFYAYQNTANMTFRLATRTSGVEGSMPKETAAGYKLDGPLHYSPGLITLTFKSATTGSSYSIEQRESDWNSDALKSNYVSLKSSFHQTITNKGKTIFVYGGTNATWVDGGVWYQINGNENIPVDEILKIAASL